MRSFARLALVALAAVALVAGLEACSNARAASPGSTLSWTHPTAYTDGSALALSAITATKITWRRPGNPTVVGTLTVAGPAASVAVPALSCGSFVFTAQTVVTTQSSDETTPLPFDTGVVCKPNPPTGLSAS